MNQMKVRQRKIYDLIKESGKMTVHELSEILNVSGPTLRKDLSMMENLHMIRRGHGVAYLEEDNYSTKMTPYESREQINQEGKIAIAKEAAKYIREGESLLLDGGTTTLQLAKLLEQYHYLTIFTPSLAIASVFDVSRVTVNLIGGIYVSENLSVHGPDTESYIRRIRVNKAFLSSTSIRADYGLMNADSLDASMQKCITESAETVFALLDSSKLMQSGAYPVADFRSIDYLVTDIPIEDAEMRASIDNAGTRLIVV